MQAKQIFHNFHFQIRNQSIQLFIFLILDFFLSNFEFRNFLNKISTKLLIGREKLKINGI